MRADEENIVSINPEGLPHDATISATRQAIRPAHHAGTTISFGVNTSAQAAIVALVDADLRPIEVGGHVLVNGIDGGDLIVGFDGELFMRGRPRNAT